MVLAFSACGVTSGTITAKHFTPAHTYTYWVQDYRTQCSTTTTVSNGKPSTSTTCRQVWVGQHQVSIFTPDDWAFDLKDAQGNTGTVSVSQRIFTQATVGNRYDSKANEVIP